MEKSLCSYHFALSYYRDVPKRLRADFEAEDSWAKKKMTDLKERIRKSGLETCDGYVYL